MKDAQPAALAALAEAITANDARRVADLLARDAGLTAALNTPLAGLSFDATPLLSAVWQGNREMIDVLLRAGADINARSGWWAGGFGVLDGGDADLASFLIERGARVDAHSAARLGMADALDALITADPSLVRARGGDGQTPLHFASTFGIATYLLDRGADIDARDIDHESTAAQYMVRDRQDVARGLVQRGCHTDILLAAALGDRSLVERHLESDPDGVRTSVSEESFPKRNPRSGGTIYTWTLGAHKTAHTIAREFGHAAIFELLMDRSPAPLQLAQACAAGDDSRVASLLARHAGLASSLSRFELRMLADAAQNNDLAAVRLMLNAGWPVAPNGQHEATALHWASFHGNVEMVRQILVRRPPLEVRDKDFQGTPLSWCIHGSVHGWHRARGDYGATADALLSAGANAPPLSSEAAGSGPVRDALRRHARR